MRNILVLLFVAWTMNASSQTYIYNLMERTDLSITEVERLGNRYFDTAGTGRGTGYKHFQRWLYERKFHVDENGFYIFPQTEWSRYMQSRNAVRTNRTTAANWTELGPSGWVRTSSWNPGTGRLFAFAVHPSNESIIYVGSPGGGIWKTTNGGTTWAPLTDGNAVYMQISSLAIDPLNPNTVYAGTTDNGNVVIKSVDGGANWVPTGPGPGGAYIRKILIHPTSPNIIFAAASNGIWRSVNGGTSWTQTHNLSKEDIEFKPDNTNIMYASGPTIYRSVDNGLSWNVIAAPEGVTGTGRTLVAVTPADPNVVYLCQASGSLFGRLYKSVDAGLTFVTTVTGNPANGTNYFGYETTGTGTSGQAGHDMALAVSPTNPNDVSIAGIICWRSTNGGTSFVATTAWSLPNSTGYNHADVHGLFYVNNSLYSISDGGVFKSTDEGDNWTDLSIGMGIRQFYRIANSQTNANVITGGAQDNGSATKQASGSWVDWLGADGMEGLVSPTNHLNIWGTSQNGSIYRSTNGGNSYSSLPRPSPGQWVTPLAIHPTNDQILYGGWTGVYKSVNGGSTWTDISSPTMSTTFADIAVAPSNPNYIYASNGSTLYVTTDDGANWNTYAAPSTINDIAIDPNNPSKIWIACNSSVNRVLVSTNNGATFTNVSGNLPNIVARAITVDDKVPTGIYVGMNIGVYYKEETAGTWSDFSDNLPLVDINELEIQKATGKIRVATYGRGVWESPVAASCTAAPLADFSASTVSVCVGQSVTFNNTSTNCLSTFAWTFVGGTPAASADINPVISYSTPGVYNVSLTVTNPAGSNTKTMNGYITVSSSLTHSISIATANTDLCANQSAVFTLTNNNGGPTPTINWLKNNVPIPAFAGLTSVTFSGLANNDIITATETSSAGCALPATVTSNAVTVTVSPNIDHFVSIATPKVQFCLGETATFTMTTVNPGTSPTISWFRNGVAIPGTSGLTAITITPANNDIIKVTEVSSAKCVTPVSVTSNSITTIVTPTPPKPIISSGIGLMVANTGGYDHQWFRNGVAIPNTNTDRYRPVLNGNYQVQVTRNGCTGPMSDIEYMEVEGINKLYPVPYNGGSLTFDFSVPDGVSNFAINVYNNLGQLIYQQSNSVLPGLNRIVYNWDRLAAGIYNIRMQIGTKFYTKRLVIQ